MSAPHGQRTPFEWRLRSAQRSIAAISAAAMLLAIPAASEAQPAPKPSPGVRAGAPPKPLTDTLVGPAKTDYEAGRLLYKDKDFASAIIKFRRAYEASKDPRLLWNIAVCEKNLRRYARVISTIRALLSDPSPLLTEQDRKEARDLAGTVQSFVSPLKLTVNEAGADVFIDDEKVGTTPLTEPVLLDVGSRKIRVSKPGFKDYTRAEEIAGGSDIILDVKLEEDIHEGRLVVIASPKDTIALDGKTLGLERWDGKVASGEHTLRVTAPDMTPYESRIVIQDDKTREVRVTLTPVASSGSLTWLWITGGAVLVAGAVVGGIFLFQPSAQKPVEGTLPPGTVPLSLSFGGRR